MKNSKKVLSILALSSTLLVPALTMSSLFNGCNLFSNGEDKKNSESEIIKTLTNNFTVVYSPIPAQKNFNEINSADFKLTVSETFKNLVSFNSGLKIEDINESEKLATVSFKVTYKDNVYTIKKDVLLKTSTEINLSNLLNKINISIKNLSVSQYGTKKVNDINDKDILATLPSVDANIIITNIERKRIEGKILVSIKLTSKINNKEFVIKVFEINGFIKENNLKNASLSELLKEANIISRSHSDLATAKYLNKPLYQLGNYNIETNTEAPKLPFSIVADEDKYSLEYYSKQNASVNIVDKYAKSFGILYPYMRKVSKYIKVSSDFDKAIASDFRMGNYFKELMLDAQTVLESYENNFNIILQNYINTKPYYGQSADIQWESQYNLLLNNLKKNTKTLEDIIKFERAYNLLRTNSNYSYYANANDRQNKENNLLINKRSKFEELNKLKNIFKNRKSVPGMKLPFEEDLFYINTLPNNLTNWFRQYINNSFVDKFENWTEAQKINQFNFVSYELELARFLYVAAGEGYYETLSSLGAFNIPTNADKNPINHTFNLNITKFNFRYSSNENMSEVNVQSHEQELNNFVLNKINQIIDRRWTDLQKVEAVHNYILWKMEYENNQTNINKYQNSLGLSLADPYNIVKNGKIVCDGYARIFVKFMYHLGIPARYIGGLSFDPNNPSGGQPHAWNEVWLDLGDGGKWYPLDLTNSDTSTGQEGYSYRYFLKNKDSKNIAFSQTHKIDSVQHIFYSDKPKPISQDILDLFYE